MKKQVFIDYLLEIVSENKEAFNNDKPAIRMLFNDVKDSLHKDSQITDMQAFNWILTDRELNKILKITKG